MKIDTARTFINLKGSPLKSSDDDEEITLGAVLANLVLTPHQQKNGFRPLKAWELAQKFYKQPVVELDTSDFVQIKELLETTETISPLVAGQIMEYFETLK